MAIKFNAKNILIGAIAIALIVGLVAFKVGPFSKTSHTTDSKAVAACQKSVETTYNPLLDTASLVAPATTATVQKQELDAKNTCISSNTH